MGRGLPAAWDRAGLRLSVFQSPMDLLACMQGRQSALLALPGWQWFLTHTQELGLSLPFDTPKLEPSPFNTVSWQMTGPGNWYP